MFEKTALRILFSTALLVSAVTVRAGTINVLNMPPGETSLQLVTVGDPGNVADPDTGLRCRRLRLPDGRIRCDDRTVHGVSQRGGRK